MPLIRRLSTLRILRFTLAILTSSGLLIAQSNEVASITFGMARVAIGMSREQVQTSIAGSSRRLLFETGNRDNIGLVYQGDRYEGQVTFNTRSRRVVYAAYHYPATRDATTLAQQIAGAVTMLDTKACLVSNYNSQGAGGSVSESLLDCGAKRLEVRTTEVIGGERSTHVQVSIGDSKAVSN